MQAARAAALRGARLCAGGGWLRDHVQGGFHGDVVPGGSAPQRGQRGDVGLLHTAVAVPCAQRNPGWVTTFALRLYVLCKSFSSAM